MVESTPFQLSRIYAQGWSAGRKCDAEDVSGVEALGNSLNPYQVAAERERWHLGFKEAASRGFSALRKFDYNLSTGGV